MTPTDLIDRRLTHVELLYRPGERMLAKKFFELLGCAVVDQDGTFFTAFIEPLAARDYANNVVYASEIRADQWTLEQEIAIEAAATCQLLRVVTRREPQRSTHFGFRVRDREGLYELVAGVKEAAVCDPELCGRVAIDAVFVPGEPGAIAPNMIQVFVWTDVVAAGMLTFGQHIEVQWHLPQP